MACRGKVDFEITAGTCGLFGWWGFGDGLAYRGKLDFEITAGTCGLFGWWGLGNGLAHRGKVDFEITAGTCGLFGWWGLGNGLAYRGKVDFEITAKFVCLIKELKKTYSQECIIICEGSHVVVAGGSLPYPGLLLIVCYRCRIHNKM